VATVLAELLLFGYMAMRWDITRDRIVQILALAQGVDLFEIKEKAMVKAEQAAIEQVSYSEILERRALEFRDLERREQALQDALDQLRFDRRKLAQQEKRYEQIQGTFEAELIAMRGGALAEGLDEVRRILESIKPDEAKTQLMQMFEQDQLDTVVLLMSDMESRKRSKIIGEFKTPQEQKKIHDVLERILDGVPDAEVAQAALERFQKAKQPTPE
jgi:hypothetical protein